MAMSDSYKRRNGGGIIHGSVDFCPRRVLRMAAQIKENTLNPMEKSEDNIENPADDDNKKLLLACWSCELASILLPMSSTMVSSPNVMGRHTRQGMKRQDKSRQDKKRFRNAAFICFLHEKYAFNFLYLHR